jgi:cyanophycinase-like exopeptidase
VSGAASDAASLAAPGSGSGQAGGPASGPASGHLDAAGHGVRPGLGLLPGCLLDRQGVQRGRLGRFLQAVAASPDAAWGLGLEEGSALVVQPGWLVEVHGPGPVLCVDARLLRLPALTANGALKQGQPAGATTTARDPTILLAAAGAPVHVLPGGWRLDLRAAQILPPAPPALPARTRRRG